MRTPRSIQLHEEFGSVHKFWRCHDRQFLLSAPETKNLYMECSKKALKHKSVNSNVALHAYCLMDNHVHMHMSYEKNSSYLSKFMRIAHSKFGFSFNKLNHRSGKVANERPKTPLIENNEHCMRVHFYIEANPIRANKTKVHRLRFYKHSSYRFYAYGIKDEWTELLTVPDWYLELGPTAKIRQERFIKLFDQYLKSESGDCKWLFYNFIGSLYWQSTKLQFVKQALKRTESQAESVDSS